MSEDNWRSVTRYITNKNHYLLINYRDSCSFAGVSVISFDVVSPMDIMLPACLVEVSVIIPPVGIFCSYFPPYLHYKQHCSHFWFLIFYFLLFRRWQPKKAQSILLWCCQWGSQSRWGRIKRTGVRFLGKSTWFQRVWKLVLKPGVLVCLQVNPSAVHVHCECDLSDICGDSWVSSLLNFTESPQRTATSYVNMCFLVVL